MKPVVVKEPVCVCNTGWNINIYFENTPFLAPLVFTSQHRIQKKPVTSWLLEKLHRWVRNHKKSLIATRIDIKVTVTHWIAKTALVALKGECIALEGSCQSMV